MPTLTLYTKPNCPLCDEALEQIEAARKQIPFELVEINILTDPVLYEAHKHNIPVLCLDEIELFRYRLTATDLVARLRT